MLSNPNPPQAHRSRPRTAVTAAVATAALLGVSSGTLAASAHAGHDTSSMTKSAAMAKSSTMAKASSGRTSSNMGMAATAKKSAPAAMAPTQTAASGLRALLTSQLVEHVYLAGTAVYAAVNTPTAFDAAAGTLDANSVDLSKSIESVYGADAGKAFLALWRTHIGFFVDYTKAAAAGDQAGKDAARMKLDGYGNDFGAFLASANPYVTRQAIADDLKVHVSTLLAAIDAVVAKNPNAFSLLKTAAGHMPMTADVLAAAIAKQFPAKFGK